MHIAREGTPAPSHAAPSPHIDGAAVRRMIEACEIAVAYQPLVSLADRTVWGCEALLRGRTDAHGAIPPTLLVESAAEADLLDAVTHEVMAQALDVGEQLRAASGVPVTMTLNLEGDQFRPDNALLDWLVGRVDATGVPVVLELSERQPMPWTLEQDLLADELAIHGIGIGLDDIGAGQSRLILLGRRPWDMVKLDRGLLLEDFRGHGPVVLRHAVALLEDYGIAGSLVEGIETAEQERIAVELGIRYGQGNGLAAAMSSSDLLSLARGGLAVPPISQVPIKPRR